MNPRITFLLLPYTCAELPGWGKLLGFISDFNWRPVLEGSNKKPSAVVLRGKRHGYLMNLDLSDWAQRMTYFLGRYYELGVTRVLDFLLRPGDKFVDIGANIGMITLHARFLVGAEGRIDCFEPNPECVEALQEHLSINGINNVFVHPCALAESAGSLRLYLTSAHSGTATLADVGGAAIRSHVVPVQVGDEVLTESPRLIKIDVEGFELHVLKGLIRTLSLHKPFLITELVESHLQRAGTSVTEISDFLVNLGYQPFGIGTTRKGRRHELVLHSLARNSKSAGFDDVLWAHSDHSAELSSLRLRK